MNKIVTTYLAVLFCLFAQAQQVSPYSRFGMGDVSQQNYSAAKSLGGINAAYRSNLNMNYNNPASYSSLSYTSLETAIRFNTSSLQTADTIFTSGDGFIDYVALGFPLTPNRNGRFKVGSSVGLVPYSQMNYNQQQNVVDAANDLTYQRLFSGNGRLYDLYYGVGFEHMSKDTLTHSLSWGLSGSYRFGELSYAEVLNITDDTGVFGSRSNTAVRVNDLIVKAGVQYKLLLKSEQVRYARDTTTGIIDSLPRSLMKVLTDPIQKRWYVLFGAYASLPSNFNGKVTETYDRFLSVGASVVTVDTVSENTQSTVDLGMPASFGVGLAIMDNTRWLIGFDAQYNRWSTVNSVANSEQFIDAFRFGLGIELTPNAAKRSVIKRTSYRFGGYYDTGALDLNGQRIGQYGITFGFGLPVTKNKEALFSGSSYINVALEVGSRGTTANNLIRETFFGGSVGIVLNDRWFQKSKYD